MAAQKPAKGHFSMLYFAAASEFTGKRQEDLPAPVPLGRLFDTLEQRYPRIGVEVLKYSLVTVNMSYVDMPAAGDDKVDQTVIQEGDEVAIIPPVSSG